MVVMERVSNLKKYFIRFLFLALLIGLQFAYFPLNQLQSGGIAPALPMDAWIPLRPAWVFPYLLAIPLWVIGLLSITLWMEDKPYRSAMLSALVAILVGVGFFTFFPTYVNRPEINGSGVGTTLLRWVYAHDQPYNALPSSHVYLTLLLTLVISRWKPRLAGLWWGVGLIICAATLFTKQHYLLDVICGAGLAFLAYWLGITVEKWVEKQSVHQKHA